MTILEQLKTLRSQAESAMIQALAAEATAEAQWMDDPRYYEEWQRRKEICRMGIDHYERANSAYVNAARQG